MKCGRREIGRGRLVGADAELHGVRVIRTIQPTHFGPEQNLGQKLHSLMGYSVNGPSLFGLNPFLLLSDFRCLQFKN